MKRFIIISLLAIVLLPCFATVSGGTKGLSVTSTEHFDIIFQEQSQDTAYQIYECCEDIYASLVDLFGADPKMHLPVVVTTDMKILNAYYTSSYQNRVVIFDTVTGAGALANFPDLIPNIFRHEMTHAFTLNLRSPFWQVVSNIFGDIVSVSPALYQYLSLIEGGAVYSESYYGYGRLNDSSILSQLRQAKIEDKFPNFIEISGARTAYPSSDLYYHFGGAFVDYLSRTYGSEKVAELYNAFGKINWFKDTEGIIKKVFGISAKDLWNDFAASIAVPEKVKQPTYLFPDDGLAYYYQLSYNKGSLYGLCATDNSVFKLSGDMSKTERLVTYASSETSLAVSDDELLLLEDASVGLTSVKLVKPNGSNYGECLQRYMDEDEEGKAVTSLRNGCFVQCDGKECVLLYSNMAQESYLSLYDLEGNKIEGKDVSLGRALVISYFSGMGDKAVFLMSKEGRDYIAVFDSNDLSVKLIDLNVKLRSLSLGEGDNGEILVCFSWFPLDADSTNMARYGELSLDSMTYRLSDVDYNGGVNNPVRLGSSVVFYSSLFEGEMLSVSSIDDQELEEAVSCSLNDYVVPVFVGDVSSMVNASVKYKPFKYMKRGILLPVAEVDGESGLGATFITQDPTETITITAAAGLGSTGPMMSLEFSDDDIFPMKVYARAHYYMENARETVGYFGWNLQSGVSTELALPLRSSNETFGLSESLNMNFTFPNEADFSFKLDNLLVLSYTNRRSTGMSRFESTGYSIQLSLANLSPSLAFAYQIPHILPFKCTGRFTFNLPATFSVGTYFNSNEKYFGFTGSAKSTLFAVDFLKGYYFMNLYLQYFVLEGGYAVTYIPSRDNLVNQSINIEGLFFFTPVIGEYLTNMKLGVGVAVHVPVGGEIKVTFTGDIRV